MTGGDEEWVACIFALGGRRASSKRDACASLPFIELLGSRAWRGIAISIIVKVRKADMAFVK